jgi:hypothetical protein
MRVTTPYTLGSGRSVDGTSGSGTLDTLLVGRWTRAVLFEDAAGRLLGSRTTWTFGADGLAQRAVVSLNFTDGLSDSIATSARWRTEGREVVISFFDVGAGVARFTYEASASRLFLGALEFARVP